MRFRKEKVDRIFGVVVAAIFTIGGAAGAGVGSDKLTKDIEIARNCKPTTLETCNKENIRVTLDAIGIAINLACVGIGVRLAYKKLISDENEKLK